MGMCLGHISKCFKKNSLNEAAQKTGKAEDKIDNLMSGFSCVNVETYLHPQRHVVHFQGGVRVIQVHLQANSLAGNGRKDGGIVGGGTHIQGVVTSTACFGQLKTQTCSFTVNFFFLK